MIQLYVITLFIDLPQVGGFLQVPQFPLGIQTPATIY